MKRKQYEIKSTDGRTAIKQAWNSSIREIERMINETAKSEQADYSLTNSESIKAGFDFVRGSREWTRADGHIVTFHIVRIA